MFALTRPRFLRVVGPGLLLAVVLTLVVAAPAAADQPMPLPFTASFTRLNPCTGLEDTYTIVGTAYVHFHADQIVAYSQRTITTSSGFVGHSSHTSILNGQIIMQRSNDVLVNEAGERIVASSTFVLDVSTETVRVADLDLRCVGS